MTTCHKRGPKTALARLRPRLPAEFRLLGFRGQFLLQCRGGSCFYFPPFRLGTSEMVSATPKPGSCYSPHPWPSFPSKCKELGERRLSSGGDLCFHGAPRFQFSVRTRSRVRVSFWIPEACLDVVTFSIDPKNPLCISSACIVLAN